MLFIHQFESITAQATFTGGNLEEVTPPVEGKLFAKEPAYDGIPKGTLRRMSKPVRMGIGAALAILKNSGKPEGIIGATAYAGMDDCFLFLEQMVQYEEGQLTPGNFVQSTPNALPAQVGMMIQNHGYNVTHVHLGLAFENAVIDATMMAEENPGKTYLLGAVDDISPLNHNINRLAGWYKEDCGSADDFYNSASNGSVPGEGAAMFAVSSDVKGSVAGITAIDTLHSTDPEAVAGHLAEFLSRHLPPGTQPDIFLSGENGDQRLLPFYLGCEAVLNPETCILRYKNMSGDFPTANSMGVWFGCYLLKQQRFPQHMVKVPPRVDEYRHILLYNTFKGRQHSFILLSGS